jgi:hypothetical protein
LGGRGQVHRRGRRLLGSGPWPPHRPSSS